VAAALAGHVAKAEKTTIEMDRVGSMFGQIGLPAGRSGVISDKNAQILEILSGQKWGVSGNFGIKHLWGLSGVLGGL